MAIQEGSTWDYFGLHFRTAPKYLYFVSKVRFDEWGLGVNYEHWLKHAEVHLLCWHLDIGWGEHQDNFFGEAE